LIFPTILLGQLDKEIESTWNFVDEEENIKVFTRKPESSSIKELRILAEVEGNMDTLIHIVNDAFNFGNWVYKCNASASLEVPDEYTVAYTATTDFPFPLSDRELVVLGKQWIDEDGRYKTHSVSAPDYTPQVKGKVRISHYESRWTIEKAKDNKIYVDYICSVDPGGNIPNWVTNLAITAGPIKTFNKLLELVKQRSYPEGMSYLR